MGIMESAKDKLHEALDKVGHGHHETEASTPPAPPTPSDPTGPGTPNPDPPLPEPDVQPSSTPGGPQVIPSPSTPPGEPGPDPDEDAVTDVRDSNPNASGAEGLGGGMGVSSERVPDDPGSIEGTGSRGTATDTADGSWPTAGGGGSGPEDDPDSEPSTGEGTHPQDPAEGPAMDRRQQAVTQEWRDDQPAANVEPVPAAQPGATSGEKWSGVDRTVGEENPAEVPPHEFDRSRNPGHSHG